MRAQCASTAAAVASAAACRSAAHPVLQRSGMHSSGSHSLETLKCRVSLIALRAGRGSADVARLQQE
eukprot:9376-Heterococcus_DN1.PRE.3